MRASRLLSILLLLQNRGRMTANELATELEVSIRTIYRDLEALGEAGVPVYADRGPAGGYQLVDGYRTRLTGLTGAEAESLSLAGMPGAAAELGLGTVLAAAELKLQAALPQELRPRAGRVRERFHLDAPGWFRSPDTDASPHLEAVAGAVWNQHALRMHYRSLSGEGERDVQPLGLVLKAGIWYMVALSAGELRTFRVSRINELTVLDERFERPDGFELADYWQEWSERFEATSFRIELEGVIRVSPEGFDRLQHRLPLHVAKQIADDALPPDAEGWRQVVIPYESIGQASSSVLALGAEAEVLGPVELRERIVGTARQLAELYEQV